MGAGFGTAGGCLGVGSVVGDKFWYRLEMGKRALGVRVSCFIQEDDSNDGHFSVPPLVGVHGLRSNHFCVSVRHGDVLFVGSMMGMSMMLLTWTSRCPSYGCVVVDAPLWRCRLSTCQGLDRLSGLSCAFIPVVSFVSRDTERT